MASVSDVPALVRRLGSRRIADREKPAEQLCQLCTPTASDLEMEERRLRAVGRALTAAGGAPLLVPRLRSGRSATRVQALAAVLAVAACDGGLGAIAAAGGVQPLVHLLGSSEQAEVTLVVAVTARLALNAPSRCQQLSEAGCVPPLVQVLLCSGSAGLLPEAVGETVTALCHVCTWHPASCDAVMRGAGVIPVLVRLLMDDTAATGAAAAAANLLSLLAYSLPDARAAVLEAGGAAALESLLRRGPRSGDSADALAQARKFAAFALCSLARAQPELLQAVAAAADGISAVMFNLEDAIYTTHLPCIVPQVVTPAWALGALAQSDALWPRPAWRRCLRCGSCGASTHLRRRSQIEAALKVLTVEPQQPEGS